MQFHRSLLIASASVAVLACGAVLICVSGSCTAPAWELRLLGWFESAATPALDALFSAVTWLGSLWLLLPAALMLAAGLVMRGRAADALRFSAAFGGACALAHGAKLLVGRERPPGVDLIVAMPTDYSFPSSHAMQITAFALATVYVIVPPAQRRFWLAAALLPIILVGVSRLYLGVHFPSDVVAGTAAAALWVFALAQRNRAQYA